MDLKSAQAIEAKRSPYQAEMANVITTAVEAERHKGGNGLDAKDRFHILGSRILDVATDQESRKSRGEWAGIDYSKTVDLGIDGLAIKLQAATPYTPGSLRPMILESIGITWVQAASDEPQGIAYEGLHLSRLHYDLDQTLGVLSLMEQTMDVVETALAKSEMAEASQS